MTVGKRIVMGNPDAGSIEREVVRERWRRLAEGDHTTDSELLARHLDKLNVRLDELKDVCGDKCNNLNARLTTLESICADKFKEE